MPKPQSEFWRKSGWRIWSGVCVFLLAICCAFWLLLFRQTFDTVPIAEIDDPAPAISTEADATLDAPPPVVIETEAEASDPQIDSPLDSESAPPVDGTSRKRFDFNLNRGPGRAEIEARTLELQPTEAEQLKMTSPELVDELVASPLQVSAYHSSDRRLDAMYRSFTRTHMGVDILLSRPDGASALLETYRAISESLVDPDTPSGEGRTGLEFATLEVLLGSTAALEQFESEGRLPTLIDTVLQSVEHQALFDATQPEPVYGEALHGNSATIVGLALMRLEDPNFLVWTSAPEREGIFVDRAPSDEESREILDMAATAFGSEVAAESPESAAP